MKIIISSNRLRNELSKIDFGCDNVINVSSKNNLLTERYIRLNTLHQSIIIFCKIDLVNEEFDQKDARWDWVDRLVNQIDDQPIVLDISNNNIRVSVNY